MYLSIYEFPKIKMKFFLAELFPAGNAVNGFHNGKILPLTKSFFKKKSVNTRKAQMDSSLAQDALQLYDMFFFFFYFHSFPSFSDLILFFFLSFFTIDQNLCLSQRSTELDMIHLFVGGSLLARSK